MKMIPICRWVGRTQAYIQYGKVAHQRIAGLAAHHSRNVVSQSTYWITTYPDQSIIKHSHPIIKYS
jgi:hypothetical protein